MHLLSMQLHIYQDDDILEKWNHSNTFYTCISHETRNKIANFFNQDSLPSQRKCRLGRIYYKIDNFFLITGPIYKSEWTQFG